MSRRDLVKIAKYYYHQGMTQQEIAEALNISRQKVNRDLQKSIDMGIVSIFINDDDQYDIQLETQLEKKFSIEQAIVIKSLSEGDETSMVAIAGARYLERIVTDNLCIGVTWGSTLYALAKSLKRRDTQQVSIVQLIGGMASKPSLCGDEIIRILGSKLNAYQHILYAPAVVSDVKAKQVLWQDTMMQAHLKKMANCDIILMGIGGLTRDLELITLGKQVSQCDIKNVKRKGAVGDIALQFYSKQGQPIDNDISNRVMGYDLLRAKTTAKRIAIAAGSYKTQAILGALNGKFIDVLITDDQMAKKLLNH